MAKEKFEKGGKSVIPALDLSEAAAIVAAMETGDSGNIDPEISVIVGAADSDFREVSNLTVEDSFGPALAEISGNLSSDEDAKALLEKIVDLVETQIDAKQDDEITSNNWGLLLSKIISLVKNQDGNDSVKKDFLRSLSSNTYFSSIHNSLGDLFNDLNDEVDRAE